MFFLLTLTTVNIQNIPSKNKILYKKWKNKGIIESHPIIK